MNATGAVISHWPWSIRAQIHRWCHGRLFSLFCSILWVTFYRSMKNMSISTEKRRMLLTNNYWRMQLTNPKVNGVILQVMLFILNTSSPVLWSFMLFNISCINFFSLCRAVFLLEWMPQTCDSFEGRCDINFELKGKINAWFRYIIAILLLVHLRCT